jgi:hypothetical protein
MYYYNEHYEPNCGLNNEKLFINMNDNSFEYKESNYNNSNLSRHLKELIEKNPLMPKSRDLYEENEENEENSNNNSYMSRYGNQFNFPFFSQKSMEIDEEIIKNTMYIIKNNQNNGKENNILINNEILGNTQPTSKDNNEKIIVIKKEEKKEQEDNEQEEKKEQEDKEEKEEEEQEEEEEVEKEEQEKKEEGKKEKEGKKKEIIFKIVKCKNKAGRNKKDKKYNKENQHNKFEINNVMTKLKRNVSNNSRDLANILLKESENPRLKNIRLCKIDKSIIEVCKKEKNLALLKTELKDLLSSKPSIKYKHYDENYNKKQIDKILKENDPKLNELLNKTVEDMVNIYVQKNVENNMYKYFRRIEDDKIKLLELYEDDGNEYYHIYEYVAKNLKTIISKRNSRESRKK